MELEQLEKAKALQNRIQILNSTLKAMQEKIRPTGKNATPMILAEEAKVLSSTVANFIHAIEFGFVAPGDPTPKKLSVPLPRVLAEKFLQDVERYYESELSSHERDFQRL